MRRRSQTSSEEGCPPKTPRGEQTRLKQSSLCTWLGAYDAPVSPRHPPPFERYDGNGKEWTDDRCEVGWAHTPLLPEIVAHIEARGESSPILHVRSVQEMFGQPIWQLALEMCFQMVGRSDAFRTLEDVYVYWSWFRYFEVTTTPGTSRTFACRTISPPHFFELAMSTPANFAYTEFLFAVKGGGMGRECKHDLVERVREAADASDTFCRCPDCDAVWRDERAHHRQCAHRPQLMSACDLVEEIWMGAHEKSMRRDKWKGAHRLQRVFCREMRRASES